MRRAQHPNSSNHAYVGWATDSFRIYLCNTGVIRDKHCDILLAASQEVIDLIASVSAQTATADEIPDITHDDTTGILDNDMGDYTDNMD